MSRAMAERRIRTVSLGAPTGNIMKGLFPMQDLDQVLSKTLMNAGRVIWGGLREEAGRLRSREKKEPVFIGRFAGKKLVGQRHKR